MWSKTIVVGNLGRDPVLRYLGSGTAVCDFSVASGRKYKKSDGTEVDETVWYTVTVWGDQAETCHKWLTKGRPVLVEGRLKPDENGNPRSFQRQDGTWGAKFEMTATDVKFLPGGGQPQQDAVVADDDSEYNEEEDFAY